MCLVMIMKVSCHPYAHQIFQLKSYLKITVASPISRHFLTVAKEIYRNRDTVY